MTTFERDYKDAKEGDGVAVLTRRKAEIKQLETLLRWTKNGIRRGCIMQELEQLKSEYNKIDSLF